MLGVSECLTRAVLSGHDSARFSFIHRRLNEYFVARKLRNHPESITLDAIPTDSRYRDALVLYCEVGATEDVQKIARFCWTQIVAVADKTTLSSTDQHLRAVHCLRFLSDAFRARPDCLMFIPELTSYIADRLVPNGDLLAAKIALEATGLLPEHSAEPILMAAFSIGNPWISETALRACRHLKGIGAKLETRLYYHYIRRIPVRDFLARYREIVFSLSLSDAFRTLRRYCRLRAFDRRLLIAGVALFFVLTPSFAILLALITVMFRSFVDLVPDSKERLPPKVEENALGRFATLLQKHLIPEDFYRILLGAFLLYTLPLSIARISVTPEKGFNWSSGILLSTNRYQSLGLAVVYMIMGLCFLPIIDIAILCSRNRKWLVSRKVLVLLLLAFTAGIVFSRIWSVVSQFFDPLFAFIGKYLIVAGLIGLVLIFWSWRKIIPELLSFRKDRRHLQNATRSIAVTRGSIAADFTKFQTRRYRLRYVEWLRHLPGEPRGEWPNGRPNHWDDDASTMLAQLDERWLGFE
jgi:hypothetical protein